MAQTSLLPVRHPNQDFFIADIFDALPVKNDRHTMEHPFFSLSTKKDIRSVEYERDGIRIKLSPSAEFGLPSMMDKDILLYVGSLLMAELNKGRIPPKKVRFSAHDLMVTTNRPTDGRAYELLKNAFERITGCLITTDIKTNGFEQTKGFHILESYEVLKSSHDKKRMVRVEVTVSDWFYNALLGKEVLTINRDYFRLRKPLERRLYELARKHCGKQPSWPISLENLKDKCGSRSTLDKFRWQIKETIKKDHADYHFPDYLIALDDDKVTFTNRIAVLQGCLPLDDDLPRISSATIRRGAAIVEDAGTGWDYHAIREQFTEQLMGGFEPDNVNAAFIGFVKKKASTRP
jgi:plasmid replication initiation protein